VRIDPVGERTFFKDRQQTTGATLKARILIQDRVTCGTEAPYERKKSYNGGMSKREKNEIKSKTA